MPVETTEILNLPFKFSSFCTPQMIFAFSSASSRTRLIAKSMSCKLVSIPQVKFIRTPFAPFIELFSSRGFEIAASVASVTLSSPSAIPVPKCTLPVSLMTALTSAKSWFIIPVFTITSIILLTPSINTLSANCNESVKEVSGLAK